MKYYTRNQNGDLIQCSPVVSYGLGRNPALERVAGYPWERLEPWRWLGLPLGWWASQIVIGGIIIGCFIIIF